MAFLAETVPEEFIAARLAFQATPLFSEAELDEATSMEIWHTNFTDPGEDWTEFRLFDQAQREIARHRQEGY